MIHEDQDDLIDDIDLFSLVETDDTVYDDTGHTEKGRAKEVQTIVAPVLILVRVDPVWQSL